MINSDLICIFVGTTINADYLKSVLHENNIECIVRNFLQEGSAAGFAAASSDDAAKVFVDEKDFEIAEEIVYKLFKKES
jgi:selenophosphate synthetase-related protein